WVAHLALLQPAIAPGLPHPTGYVPERAHCLQQQHRSEEEPGAPEQQRQGGIQHFPGGGGRRRQRIRFARLLEEGLVRGDGFPGDPEATVHALAADAIALLHHTAQLRGRGQDRPSGGAENQRGAPDAGGRSHRETGDSQAAPERGQGAAARVRQDENPVRAAAGVPHQDHGSAGLAAEGTAARQAGGQGRHRGQGAARPGEVRAGRQRGNDHPGQGNGRGEGRYPPARAGVVQGAHRGAGGGPGAAALRDAKQSGGHPQQHLQRGWWRCSGSVHLRVQTAGAAEHPPEGHSGAAEGSVRPRQARHP
ncbi:hypothetical protein KR067_000468, partial [Drosophila pandora]